MDMVLWTLAGEAASAVSSRCRAKSSCGKRACCNHRVSRPSGMARLDKSVVWSGLVSALANSAYFYDNERDFSK